MLGQQRRATKEESRSHIDITGMHCCSWLQAGVITQSSQCLHLELLLAMLPSGVCAGVGFIPQSDHSHNSIAVIKICHCCRADGAFHAQIGQLYTKYSQQCIRPLLDIIGLISHIYFSQLCLYDCCLAANNP